MQQNLKKVLKEGLKGKDKSCEYFPCHSKIGDCTWCFCPFYPCGDESTGGKWKGHSRTGKQVFSCIDCSWIHRKDVAWKVLVKLRKLDESGSSFKELLSIRKKLLFEDK